jgi:hypothetical protein
MRADSPLTALQLRELIVLNFGAPDFAGLESVSLLAAALADTTLQSNMPRLRVAHTDIQIPEVLDALVDAVLPRRLLRELTFIGFTPPAPAPLARLLRGSALARLYFSGSAGPMFDAAGATLVADALRASTTLEALSLRGARLCESPVACVVLRALVGHPRLQTLYLTEENPIDSAAVGAALAELVTANTPALRALHLRAVKLKDAGLAPILDALPNNQRLHYLGIQHTGASEAFSRDRLLSAVRANTSLLDLFCGGDSLFPAEEEAQELVRNRRRLPPHR